jgi:hypothetical protein
MDVQTGSEERSRQDQPQDLAGVRSVRQEQDDREKSPVVRGDPAARGGKEAGSNDRITGDVEGADRKVLKLDVYRVYFHTITEVDGKEVSRTSPVMKMIAAEEQGHLFDALPEPPPGARNVIVQIDQRYKEVLYHPRD